MDPYRLPESVLPSRYTLELAPDLERAAFTGEVAILVEAREPTAEVWLNVAELEVLSASVAQAGRRQQADVELEAATERCRLLFPHALQKGPAELFLGFRGTLNDKLRGFYRSRYCDASGKEQLLAVTQFEATDAR